MKEVHKIIRKEGSDFWKNMQKAAGSVEEDAEKAATEAADRARKEVLAKAAKRAAEDKAYRDSLKEYDKLEFNTHILRELIQQNANNRKALHDEINELWKIEKAKIAELQSQCKHEMVIERRTSWTDEYSQWHEGPHERKCVECFLVEEQKHEGYVKLAKSQRVLLRRIVDGKEYELEFDDLKWD